VIFTPTAVGGVFLVDLQPREDERGFFARSWCRREFADMGLETELVQCNVSLTRQSGTLRGLHWQHPPHGEAKLVRCTRGALWDVAVDLRPDSPSYLQHVGVELTAENRRALFLPVGCAHGFQTLVGDTEIFYQMSACYAPDAQRGARWDDPSLGITWPIAPPTLTARDAAYPDLHPEVLR
jgi:dTDP-4-dehydrorhamnose 3,5-epimerase